MTASIQKSWRCKIDEDKIWVDFDVSVCLGWGDGGDVCVSVHVSEEEYELLKECRREDYDIDGYPGLEDLTKRIESEAKSECRSCMSDIDSEEEINYDNVSCIIRTPSDIYEDNEEDYEDEDAADDEADDEADNAADDEADENSGEW